jgi:subtilase family serine protease
MIDRAGAPPGRRRRYLITAAGILACTLLLACPATADMQNMVKLVGNHPTGVVGEPTGRMAPQRMLTITVTLKLRDQEGLQRLLSQQQNPSSPDYRRWLTPQEFSSRFGPDPSQFKAVRHWLAAQGFEIESSSMERRSITVKGSAGLAERVFQTEIMTYAGDSYANAADPSIPAQFATVIGAISGLDNIAHAVPLSSR